MRPGIRLQLLGLLGALLVLAFVPLYFAVARLTQTTVRAQEQEAAHALGRAIGAHVLVAVESRGPEDIAPLLDAQVGEGGVSAIVLFDASGQRLFGAGEERAQALLVEQAHPVRDAVVPVGASHDRALAVTMRAVGTERVGAVGVLVPTDDETAGIAPLLGLVALYTIVFGFALLVVVYFAMTRAVIQPIEGLKRAASRVADGARELDVPRKGARELADLGQSVAAMLSALRRDEEALQTKVQELEKARADLLAAQDHLIRSERLASVGRLSAGVAHEIGNPISAILGFLELLLAGGLTPEEERDFLERMKKETERIHVVLRDLLDFARPARAASRAEPEPGDVRQAIAETLALTGPQKQFRDVEVDLQAPTELPRVALPTSRLVQVFLNLLLNAADAMSGKGEVRIVCEIADDELDIWVTDTGPGVAEPMRESLFEPFATSKEVGHGTGMGLSVCRGLIDDAGGTIELVDAPDGSPGACFYLRLPTTQDEATDETSSSTTTGA